MNIHSASKIALVTGASQGLGLEIARLLVQRGYFVILNARDPKRLQMVERELGDNCLRFAADVTNTKFSECLKALMQKLKLGYLDLVIHSAGINHMGRISETKMENARQTFNINSCSVIALAQTTRTYLEAGSSPRFVYVSSVMQYAPMPGRSVYAASKAAGEQIATAWAVELRAEKSPIRVQIFRPAGIETAFHDNTPTDGHAPRSNVSRMSAAKAAGYVMQLIDSKKYDLAPGFKNKIVAFVAQHFTGFARWLLVRRAK